VRFNEWQRPKIGGPAPGNQLIKKPSIFTA